MKDFTPVLLGSDVNVYGMARGFHLEYGIPSYAIGKARLAATKDSHIVTVEVEPDLENPEIFVSSLLAFKQKHPDERLLLVPCGDNYIKLLVQTQDRLKDHYAFSCIDQALFDRLSLKESFYETCRTYGLDFPETAIIEKDSYADHSISIPFPRIIKPSDSVKYWNCSFPYKKKVFLAETQQEYDDILRAVYTSTYNGNLIIQEFVPGDDSAMHVLNCFSGKDGRVRLIAHGHALLEEHTPEGIGSYAAIINACDMALIERIKAFLEEIGYIGFSNFDMKYDVRDGAYKLFEINLRPGRSSFFVTGGGYNLAKFLADDIIYNKEQDFVAAKEEYLWTIIPRSVIFKYVADEALKEKAKALIKQGRVNHALFYKGDTSLKRTIQMLIYNHRYVKRYKDFFGNKGLR